VNLILFGPPGAGKGTQANNLVRHYDLFKVSTGDLLRSEINNNTQLGEKIQKTIESGSFVSDHIINDLIENTLKNKKYANRFIFDGYPRTLNQARNLNILLKKFDQKISCVLCLNVKKDTIKKRILGRQICKKCGLIFNEFFNPSTKKNHSCETELLERRSDDSNHVIESRYESYIKQTLPIINFYKEMNLMYEINAEHEIGVIFKEIQGIISSIKG